jgi:hypothetical protein
MKKLVLISAAILFIKISLAQIKHVGTFDGSPVINYHYETQTHSDFVISESFENYITTYRTTKRDNKGTWTNRILNRGFDWSEIYSLGTKELNNGKRLCNGQNDSFDLVYDDSLITMVVNRNQSGDYRIVSKGTDTLNRVGIRFTQLDNRLKLIADTVIFIDDNYYFNCAFLLDGVYIGVLKPTRFQSFYISNDLNILRLKNIQRLLDENLFIQEKNSDFVVLKAYIQAKDPRYFVFNSKSKVLEDIPFQSKLRTAKIIDSFLYYFVKNDGYDELKRMNLKKKSVEVVLSKDTLTSWPKELLRNISEDITIYDKSLFFRSSSGLLKVNFNDKSNPILLHDNHGIYQFSGNTILWHKDFYVNIYQTTDSFFVYENSDVLINKFEKPNKAGGVYDFKWFSEEIDSFYLLVLNNKKKNWAIYETDVVTTIEYPVFSNKTSAFPNPFKSSITLETKSNIEEVRIYNVQGQRINSYSITVCEYGLKVEFLEDLESGVYIIELVNQEGIPRMERVMAQ